jgi:hypothetical protein
MQYSYKEMKFPNKIFNSPLIRGVLSQEYSSTSIRQLKLRSASGGSGLRGPWHMMET